MANKHYKTQKKRKDKPLRPMGAIPQLEVVKPCADNAPDAIIHAEGVTETQPSRGETLKPVYGGYQHSFNSYSHTIWGKGAKV